MARCSVRGCKREHEARGFCATHYMQFRRRNPDAPLVYEYGLSAAEKASRFYEVGSLSECWLWTGTLNKAGYGRVDGGRSVLAHRVVWEARTGRVAPRGKVLMHTCDVRNCVNPAHLVVGTQAENMADMWKKNRGSFDHLPLIRGESHHCANFTEEDVRAIRSNKHETSTAIAKRYGVHRTSIIKIRSRKTWKHVT